MAKINKSFKTGRLLTGKFNTDITHVTTSLVFPVCYILYVGTNQAGYYLVKNMEGWAKIINTWLNSFIFFHSLFKASSFIFIFIQIFRDEQNLFHVLHFFTKHILDWTVFQ